LTASAGAGGVYVSEANGVMVSNLTVAVNRVGTDASVPVTASGSATVTQEDLTTSSNGSVELISQSGSIMMNDGVSADGISVQAGGSGYILLRVLGSDITINADILSGSGSITVEAVRNVVSTGSTDIRTSAPVSVKATEGDVLTPDLKISAGTSTVTLFAKGVLDSGDVQTSGTVTFDVSATGEVVFNKPVDSKGNDITITSNTVDISTSLNSVGGDLIIKPLQPTDSTPVNIRIGGVEGEAGNELHLSLNEISNIKEGFKLITFGSNEIIQSIVVDGNGISDSSSPVVFNDPVLFDNSAMGSHLILTGKIYAEELTILGSGSTTDFRNLDLTSGNNYLHDDAANVIGDSAAIAGVSGAGDVTITGTITGSNSSNRDTLTLRANGGDVLLKKAISGIDALTITSAIDVSFEGSIDITGALLIHATGDVKFSSSLNLTAGGTLSIFGAKSITFANGVSVDGDVTLDAESIELLSVLPDSLMSKKFGSTLTITSASTSHNIRIGDAVGQRGSDQLNLTTRELSAIGENFSQVTIGELGAGAVTVVGNTDLTSVAGADFIILGNTITLEGNAGDAVQVPGALSLHASGNVLLNSGISTAVTSNLSVVSGGSLIMAQETRLDSRGGDIDLVGNGLAVGNIFARSEDFSVRGVVNINAGSGTVTDANRNSTADVFAKAINFSGYGPATGTAGDVLEVYAEVVQITPPQGQVIRHTGADGQTYFNVVNGAERYQQLIVVRTNTNVTRVTEDPAALLKKTDAEKIAAGLPTNSSLLSAPVLTQSTEAFFSLAPKLNTTTAVSRYLAPASTSAVLQGDIELSGSTVNGSGDDLLSDSSFGLASRPQQAYILGTPGEQPLVSGLGTFSQDTFEYWVDTLSL
jgi:hypothetical protein